MPPFPDCSDPNAFGKGWNLHDQVIIVTPDFQHDITECEPCSMCTADSCVLGADSVSLTSDGALNVNVGLGLDRYGMSAGALGLRSSSPTLTLSTPSALECRKSPGSQLIRGADGVVRQIRNSQGLVDIVTTSSTSYELRFYTLSHAGTIDATGLYVPTPDSQFKTIAVANPDATGTTFNELHVTTSGEGVARASLFTWSDADQSWTLTTGNGLRQESNIAASDPGSGNRANVYTIMDGSGQNVLYQERQTVHSFPWGDEVIQKVVDPNGAALTTTWSYYDDPENDDDNYSHLKQVVQPSGYWEIYQYDSSGRTIGVDAQFEDSPSENCNGQCHITTTTYGTGDPAATVVETIQGQEISRRYTLHRQGGEVWDIQATAPNANWNSPNNLVTITRSYLGGLFEGKVQSVKRPDGTMTIYQYQYVASDGGSNLITTVSTGEPNGSGTAIVNGTKTVTTMNLGGVVLGEETYGITEGTDTLLESNHVAAVDDFGRATQIHYSDGTSVTTVYGCCGVLSTTDREGVTTTYTYDALTRPVTTTRAGITTSNNYDAAGHVLSTVRIGTDNSKVTLNRSTYDVAGRLTSSTDGIANTTSYSEMIDGDSQNVRTTTYPDQTTRIETYYQDGQLLSVKGTDVHGVRYVYGADANGRYTQEIKLNTDGSDSGEWTKTYTDMVGRPSLIVYSDGASSTSFYNSQGQLAKQVDPDGVMALFSCNARGELETTAIDMDQNGQIDFDGTDRITQMENSVVTAHGTTVRRTTTSVWTNDNVEASSVVSINDVSADGLQSWSILYGLTNHAQTVYNGNGQRTVTTTNPDGSVTVSQYQSGRLVSTRQYGSDNAQIAGTTYSYDPHGRLSTQMDARNGATTFTHDNDDRITSVTASGQTTSYFYDGLGRQTQVTLPDNGTVNFAYCATGELATNSGARAYPVAYTYDYAGRMKTMTTWQDYPTSGSAATTWDYDANRGFLISKTYADNSSVTYSNSAAGRLLARGWARTVGGQPLSTTYGYNHAGDLGTITYSDGTTPNVFFTYDRRGRRTQVLDGAGTHTLAYTDADQLLTESFPNSGLSVTNAYDTLLRRSSLSFAGQSTTYGYDNASRLQSVSDGTHSATYSYLANSSLVSNIVFRTSGLTKMTTTRSYDNLNRLTKIDSRTGVSPVSSFEYQYNSANQRTRAELQDGSYWLYQYDSLGQVTSGKKYWPDGTEVAGQQFGYDFDEIGNRKSAVSGGSASTSIYSANSLNQYTQRTVPPSVWELGVAGNKTTVTVNNEPTSRKGEYFSKELNVLNIVGAVYTQLTTVAVLKNSGGNINQPDIVSSSTGKVFVAQSPEMFGYDSDGNLTNDGRWVYSWDAENRLIAVETAVSAVAAGAPHEKLLFAYDSQGRRISKTVSNWNGSAWSEISNLKFVYDGWNLIAELSPSSFPLSLVRSYTWGLDLSGSEQGAGGVGGLLAVTTHQSPATTHYVAYDGNGNVTALTDADSGSLSAQYEYGPFGETLRATGSLARENPFRFSSKPADNTTGLVLYEYRPYHPNTGRWLTRDYLEEDGGANLYGYVRNDVPGFVDPQGLNLYAIDGTGSDEDTQSNVSKFVGRYSPSNGQANYYRGVGNPADNWRFGQSVGGAFGAGAAGLVKKVACQICTDYHKDSNIKIDIVGFSRGAAIANEIATELQKNGCPGPWHAWIDYPPVRFLGLFDAVYSFPRYVSWAWNDETIPSNVQNAAHAFASNETRITFRPAILQPSSPNTHLNEQWFPGRHSDIGGTFDMNQVIGIRTLRWMIERAMAAGVQMDDKGLPSVQQIEDFIRTHPRAARPGPKTPNPTAWIND